MSTAAIQRARPAASVSAAVATAQIFPDLGTPTLAAVLLCPGSSRLEQKRFEVRASGIVTVAGAFTATLSLYGALVAPAAPLVAANWTLLGASGATAVATTTAGWEIQAELSFDSVSGKLQGIVESCVNNITVARAAIANQVTAINGVTEPVMVFAIGVTFSAANAGNIGKMADFCLDA